MTSPDITAACRHFLGAGRFAKITQAQTDAMNYIAFSGCCGGRSPHGKVAKALVERGWIVPVENTTRDRLGTFTFTTYEMPLAIHMLWCEHVSADMTPEELAELGA